MKDGLSGTMLDLTREEYDAITGHNWSRIKHMARSPAHYLHNLLHKQPDKDAFRLGRVTHLATYEPDRVSSAVAVWDGGVRRGKAWDAFKSENCDREIVTEVEYAACLAVAGAARAQAREHTMGGRAEQTLLWTDEVLGVQCKARLDFIADAGVLVDLKTTKDGSLDRFAAESWRYGYHVQAAFYSDGYARVTGKKLPYVLLVVEKEAPHVVSVRPVPEPMLELGRAEYRRLLHLVVECQAQSKWPAYSALPVDLEPPRWAKPWNEDVEDISDLELESNNGF